MKCQLSMWVERFWFWVVRRSPRRLIYYSVIVCWAEATCNKHSDKGPNEVTWDMALKAWERK